jgi:hypothetical protein
LKEKFWQIPAGPRWSRDQQLTLHSVHD